MKTNQSKTTLWLRSRSDFSRFYDQYAPVLYGHFLRQTNKPGIAAVQIEKLFVTAWNWRDDFNRSQSVPDKDRPVAWLLVLSRETNPAWIGLGQKSASDALTPANATGRSIS